MIYSEEIKTLGKDIRVFQNGNWVLMPHLFFLYNLSKKGFSYKNRELRYLSLINACKKGYQVKVGKFLFKEKDHR